MPMLKTIAGHTSARGIRRYLTKKNRALAEDLINIDAPEGADAFDWAAVMDETRRAFGNDLPWRGRRVTLIWEGSCGSGTIACAVAESTGLADGLFEQDYFQPAGVVRASIERRGGAVVSAAIGGPVTLDEPVCITL